MYVIWCVQRRISCVTPAECNLEFICTYLRARPPSAPIRTFVDDWFAYHTGGPFLNRAGRPRWFNRPCPIKNKEALLSMHYISEQAEKVIKNGAGDSLIKEHAVPVRVLRTLFDEMKSPTISEVEKFLLRHYRLGVLTTSDNRLLKEAGLNSSMPKNWDGVDMFARYNSAEIKGRINSNAKTLTL